MTTIQTVGALEASETVTLTDLELARRREAAAFTRRVTAAPDLVRLARTAGHFKTLLAAARAAGLAGTLAGEGPFTVLAPTDDAFGALPDGMVEELFHPEGRDMLRAVLQQHIIRGRANAADLLGRGSAATMEGRILPFRTTDGQLTAAGVTIARTDLEARNGFIHVIDEVILPDATPTHLVARFLQGAIAKSEPFLADGDVAACAALYEVTAHAVLIMDTPALTNAQRAALGDALAVAERDTDRHRAARRLRAALDAVRIAVDGR